MHREALEQLVDWTVEHHRKPLVIRGARQVGKTWLVRELARTHFEHLLEVNFDRHPNKAGLVSTDIDATIRYLEADTGVPVVDGKTLLFFDKVQAAPDVLHVLRYFYELRPNLHVIAAGSLLDFVLADHAFSMPVGRVSFFHLGPMRFTEFLVAHDEAGLVELISQGAPLPAPLHARLLNRVRDFFTVGGMPAAVAASASGANAREVRHEQDDLLQAFREDFAKYGEPVDTQLLRQLFDRLPQQVCRKVKYVNFSRDATSSKVAAHLDQLVLARLAYPVHASVANGLPLAAEANPRAFKLLHLDIGLLTAQLGRPFTPSSLRADDDDDLWVNEGQLAEQFVGQHLLYRDSARIRPDLHYWLREAKSSTAEVDFMVAHDGAPLPVEVKAGAGGSLKSLHVYCQTRGATRAVRFNAAPPLEEDLDTNIPLLASEPVRFTLRSLPLYAVEQLRP